MRHEDAVDLGIVEFAFILKLYGNAVFEVTYDVRVVLILVERFGVISGHEVVY